MAQGEFDPASYRVLIEALVARGYQPVGYAEAEPAQRHVIMRHDIDMSLEAALSIAEIERSHNISAHYFVLVRTEMYNVFSAAGRKALQELSSLGHRIGLHLDASLYGNDPEMLQRAAADECSVLETATESFVHVISFHRPAKVLLGQAETLAGRIHTYQPRYFSEMGYCSDSRGGWHHGRPLDHDAVRRGRALQLLTHPIWWTGDASTPERKLTAFLAQRMDVLDRAVADNCSIHRPGRLRES